MTVLRFKVMPSVHMNPEPKSIDIAKMRTLCEMSVHDCLPEGRAVAFRSLLQFFLSFHCSNMKRRFSRILRNIAHLESQETP
jgi:hypothetical protein